LARQEGKTVLPKHDETSENAASLYACFGWQQDSAKHVILADGPGELLVRLIEIDEVQPVAPALVLGEPGDPQCLLVVALSMRHENARTLGRLLSPAFSQTKDARALCGKLSNN
jgi:hypothetical protein